MTSISIPQAPPRELQKKSVQLKRKSESSANEIVKNESGTSRVRFAVFALIFLVTVGTGDERLLIRGYIDICIRCTEDVWVILWDEELIWPIGRYFLRQHTYYTLHISTVCQIR